MDSDLSQDRELITLPRDGDGRPTVGRIPLEQRIGRGGMGSVYYALHPRLHVPVAVKILPHHLLEEDPSLADRFVSEARLAASLENENIVRVYDVDREGPTLFLVMAYVDGESAGSILRTRGKLAESDALALVTAATRGLAAAHARGIIHRDIKPDNILVPREGGLAAAKLADLGLAKPVGSGKTVGTTANVAMGTPGYMPPEQIDDARSVGPAADVFAMGATLYALLSGAAPFSGTSVAAILRDTGSLEPPPMPVDVSAATREIVARCLAKDPARRYPNGTELLRALAGIAPSTPATQVSPPPPRARVPVWFVLLMLLTAGAVGIWLARPSVPTHGLVARWEARGNSPDSARKAADYLARRLRERGFPHAQVAEVSSESLAVRVPGARSGDEAVIRAIGEAGTFEFREVGNRLDHLSIGTPAAFEEIPTPANMPDRDYFKGASVRVRREPVVTGADVLKALAEESMASWSVSIELTPDAARRFDALAAKLYNDDPKGCIAVFVNGKVVSVPTVQADRFGTRASISGGMNQAEAEALARGLQGGGLPCRVEWKGAARYGE